MVATAEETYFPDEAANGQGRNKADKARPRSYHVV